MIYISKECPVFAPLKHHAILVYATPTETIRPFQPKFYDTLIEYYYHEDFMSNQLNNYVKIFIAHFLEIHVVNRERSFTETIALYLPERLLLLL